jgi:hypothetical protein
MQTLSSDSLLHGSEVKMYLIGQRVIVNGEIGTIVKPEHYQTNFGQWVYLPSRGYASDYALHNIKPLPNGQL